MDSGMTRESWVPFPKSLPWNKRGAWGDKADPECSPSLLFGWKALAWEIAFHSRLVRV